MFGNVNELTQLSINTSKINSKVFKVFREINKLIFNDYNKNTYLSNDFPNCYNTIESIVYNGNKKGNDLKEIFKNFDKINSITFNLDILNEGDLINLPNIDILLLPNIKKIDKKAFINCEIKEIIINNNIENIEVNAFEKCIIGKLSFFDNDIQNTVYKIDNNILIKDNMIIYACVNSQDIDEFTLPSDIDIICEKAFENCKINKLNCKNIKEIGKEAFYEAEIQSLEFSEELISIDENILLNAKVEKLCIAFIGKEENNYKHLSYLYDNNTVDNSLKEVKLLKQKELDHTFNNCQELEKIILPENLESIKNKTFENCLLLDTLRIPNSVKQVDDYVFLGCNYKLNVLVSDRKEVYKNYSKNFDRVKEKKLFAIHDKVNIVDINEK